MQCPLLISSWMLLAITIFGTLSVLLNISDIAVPLKNIFKLKYFFITFLGVFAMRALVENYMDKKRLKRLINTFLITTMVASTSGLVGLLTGFNPLRFKDACHADRACGMYGMYMSYGYGIQFVVILLFGMLIFKKQLSEFISDKIFYPSLVINSLGLFFSYTRGGWIGAVAGIFMILFFKNKKVFLIGLLVLSSIAGVGLMSSTKLNDTFFSKNRLYSNSVRISQYKAAWMAFRESPVMGIGYKNFEPNSSKLKIKYGIEHKQFNGHAHNNFLEHLASAGGVGFLLLVAFHLFWFIESIRLKSSPGYISAGVVTGLTISGQFQNTLGDGETLFMIMALYMLFSGYVFKIDRAKA